MRNQEVIYLITLEIRRSASVDRPRQSTGHNTQVLSEGHSMGGMISAELGAIARREVGAPHSDGAGRAMARRSLSKLPHELLALLFHDPDFGRRVMTAGADFDDPKFLEAFVICNTLAGDGGQTAVPDP